jgi:hypothetical protein
MIRLIPSFRVEVHAHTKKAFIMAPLKILFAGLALATHLFYVDLSMAATTNALAPGDQPKLTLEGANGQNHCTLDFKTGTYVFKSNNHCRNDQAIGLELEHVPSASNVWLYDDYTCDHHDSGNYFWVALRIIKNDTTTLEPIDLDKFASAPIDSIIVPGVQLKGRYVKANESMKNRTSCVRIEVDAPPPVFP